MEAPALAQPAYEAHAQYQAPWRERLPDGSLSEPYGPPSASAQAAQTARLRNWSWKAPGRDQRRSKLSVELAAVDVDREALSARERQVLELVLEGHAIRWIARHLGMRRESVRTYVQRIRAKAGR